MRRITTGLLAPPTQCVTELLAEPGEFYLHISKKIIFSSVKSPVNAMSVIVNIFIIYGTCLAIVIEGQLVQTLIVAERFKRNDL